MQFPLPVEELDTPALVVDEDRLDDNIRRMAEFARQHGVALRPHVKAHKTPEIAHRQIRAGAIGITVAKLGEAEVMADAGIDDILVAYPIVGPAKVDRLLALARKVKVSTIVDSLEGATPLSEAFAASGMALDVLIKVDTGLGRCGLPPGEPVVSFAREVSRLPGLRFRGICTHAGHAYGARNDDERRRIGREEGQIMAETARLLTAAGYPPQIVSVGSTPTATISGTIPGVTEIRPGNYAFNDAIQIALGSALPSQVSLFVLCRVISHPAPDRAIIDAGSKTFGLDAGAHGTRLVSGYGRIVNKEDIVIERLSEEHGILRLPPGESTVRIGELFRVVPNHACSVVNNFDQLAVVSGGMVKDYWRVAARGKLT